MPSTEQIVLVTSATRGDPLHTALTSLVEGYPTGAVRTCPLSGPDAVPAAEVVAAVSSAIYLVLQEPTVPPQAGHIAAAAAARAAGVPMLVVSPLGPGMPELMRLADLPASQVAEHPVQLDDAEAWERFRQELARHREDIRAQYERRLRVDYLGPITGRLSSAAKTLEEAAPTEEVAWAIARIFDTQTSSISLDNHIDFLQITFPAAIYTQLLNQLTMNFASVRTIADPVAEQLPWDDPVGREQLATVSERIFLVDEAHARQYGIEPVIAQVSQAAGAGGVVSVLGLTEGLGAELDRVSAVDQRLKGLNRFFAGDNIVGGYADDSGQQVRLLAYHDSKHTEYVRQTAVLEKVDRLRKPLPPDRALDTTALASWIYSNVLTEPRLNTIFDHESADYANDYDGNIVRVTPGYYRQLDVLAGEVKRALIDLYSPYSGGKRASIRMLELGFGTGALTGRLMRMLTQFLTEVRSERERAERPFVEFDGWEANARMVEIAHRRLLRGARRHQEMPVQPNLREVRFDPNVARSDDDKYDLVVGSYFSHYWTDSRPDRPLNRAQELTQLRGFLTAVQHDLLAPGGFALFLDAFYTSHERRHEEELAWSRYVADELGSKELASGYLSRNPWQFYAPSTAPVEAVARELGFRCWWWDAQPGYPFQILALGVPRGDDPTA